MPTFSSHSDTQNAAHTRYNFSLGTSYAAPHVCGAISLLLARAIQLDIVDVDTWEGLDFDDMYLILRLSARDQVSSDTDDTEGWDEFYGHGLIDIAEAFEVLDDLF